VLFSLKFLSKVEEIRYLGPPSYFAGEEHFEKFHCSAVKRPWLNTSKRYNNQPYEMLLRHVRK
jgi:hypothetical protein